MPTWRADRRLQPLGTRHLVGWRIRPLSVKSGGKRNSRPIDGQNRSRRSSRRPLHKGDHVFLIDGLSYVFRAYFAMFKAAQARAAVSPAPTACRWRGADLLQHALEAPARGARRREADPRRGGLRPLGQSFRNEIYSDYKGHRPDPPDELLPQFPLMREAVSAFGLIPIEQEGFEADDLIATYARVALEEGADVTIVAGDKDLMQLVRPGIMMFDPMPGNERRVDDAYVVEKFGVPPAKCRTCRR